MNAQPQSHASDNKVITLDDGRRVLLRPLIHGDIDLDRRFIEGLSPTARRNRFLGNIERPSEALLEQLADVDQRRRLALIAVLADVESTEPLGVARYAFDGAGDSAEMAIAVADEWHHHGIGRALLEKLIAVARENGVRRLYSVDSSENFEMAALMKELGFESRLDAQDARQTIHSKVL